MLLSVDELVELTGKTRRGAQGDVLRALGIPFKARPDGSLVVLRDAVQAALGYATAKERSPSPQLRLPETRRVLARQGRQVDAPRR